MSKQLVIPDTQFKPGVLDSICPKCNSNKSMLLDYSLFAVWAKCYGCGRILYVREPPRRTDVIDNYKAQQITWEVAMKHRRERLTLYEAPCNS